MHHSDDVEVARRTLAGEQAAFDVLFERFYGPLLVHPARTIGPGPLARAVTEAGFVELIERLRSYRGEAPLAAIALSVVRRLTAAAVDGPRPLVTVEPSAPGKRAGVGA